jgi:hypothetical protein
MPGYTSQVEADADIRRPVELTYNWGPEDYREGRDGKQRVLVARSKSSAIKKGWQPALPPR